MIRHFYTRQFLGFLAVGGFSAFLHWAARIVLNIWIPFSWAVVAAYAIGMSTAFCLYSIYIFPKSSKQKHLQARDFIIVNLAFFPIVWGASLALDYSFKQLGMVNFRHELSHAIAVVLPTIATFLIYKFFAFKDANYGKS